MAIDILELSNELIYRAYTMNRNQVRKHMDELNFRDYIALQRITQLALSDGVYSGRAYLKDIADNMKLSMRQTSKMAEELKNRGLVTWSHDGDGKASKEISRDTDPRGCLLLCGIVDKWYAGHTRKGAFPSLPSFFLFPLRKKNEKKEAKKR